MSGKIVGSVRGQVLHLIYPPLVEGTVDYLTAEFSFSGDWDGLSKWAHFKQGSTIYDVTLTNDAITEDQHLNLSAGTWDVYLHGSGDNRRITTTTVRMKVLPYLDEDGEPLPEVPLTFSEVLDQRAQRIQAVAYAVEAGESARKEAERSRELSEFARVQAEAERTGAEAGRASAEAVRASAETARKNAEQDRVSSENARSSAEDTRKTNEEARQAAEAIREQNEDARVEAEKNRKDGITPHIGDNGNWYLGDTDTGKPSRGETGAGMDITGATVGQIAKITAVDDTGKPTAWGAVDMPISFKPAGKSYLTFSSPFSFTLEINDSTKHWDGTLEYFASDKTWTVWDGTTTLSAIADDGEYVLHLRGTGNTIITGSSANHRWVLTGTDIKCIGDIENLLDYATVASGEHPTTASSCYSFMFRGCTGLTQAPELPATTLADNCYQGMFQGCTSITRAPALPAITLASYCYNSMFYGCKGLTQVPALPATTLENSCYSYIFTGCTSLTQAPALPAKTLADSCYYYMFYGCTGLIQAPALPATTLVGSCYRGMFYGCTSLKLSSTQTGEYTQEYRIPSSGEGTTAPNSLTEMFTGTGGTFTGTPDINTTYYLSSDNMIVRETETATLNGYVESMIDAAIAEHTSNPLNITGATVGQIAKITAVDDTGKPTAWEAVDDRLPNASPSDDGKVLAVEQTGEFEYGYGFADMPKMYDFIDLGIDSASPGQFAKVAYVDDFGHPTAWEAVDMPTGGGSEEMRVIKTITITAADVNSIYFNRDDNGLPFALTKRIRIRMYGAATNTGSTQAQLYFRAGQTTGDAPQNDYPIKVNSHNGNYVFDFIWDLYSATNFWYGDYASVRAAVNNLYRYVPSDANNVSDITVREIKLVWSNAAIFFQQGAKIVVEGM